MSRVKTARKRRYSGGDRHRRTSVQDQETRTAATRLREGDDLRRPSRPPECAVAASVPLNCAFTRDFKTVRRARSPGAVRSGTGRARGRSRIRMRTVPRLCPRRTKRAMCGRHPIAHSARPAPRRVEVKHGSTYLPSTIALPQSQDASALPSSSALKVGCFPSVSHRSCLLPDWQRLPPPISSGATGSRVAVARIPSQSANGPSIP